MSRSRAIAVTLVAGMTLSLDPRPAVAEEPSIPLDLQAQLSAKIVEYVESPPLGGAEQVPIGVLVKARDADSMRAGIELRAAFARVGSSSRRTFDVQIIQWAGAGALVEELAHRKLAIIYLTPGLSADLAAVIGAVAHRRVLTIAAVDTYVAEGAILGYELSSGHPRMILNLRQAKSQEVLLRAALMKLARIVE
jgi:uncharacterized membrane protein